MQQTKLLFVQKDANTLALDARLDPLALRDALGMRGVVLLLSARSLSAALPEIEVLLDENMIVRNKHAECPREGESKAEILATGMVQLLVSYSCKEPIEDLSARFDLFMNQLDPHAAAATFLLNQKKIEFIFDEENRLFYLFRSLHKEKPSVLPPDPEEKASRAWLFVGLGVGLVALGLALKRLRR